MWPFSALRDFNKKRQEDTQLREREKVLARFIEGVEQDKPFWRGAAICDLCQFPDSPGMAGIAAGLVDKVEAKYGVMEAMHDAIYFMNSMNNKEVQSTVAERTFALAAKVDRADEKKMASVAMAANLIAFNADEGSDQRERSMALWREAVGTLSKTRVGVDFAFAAASNAALGGRNFVVGRFPHPLRSEAIDSWYRNVTELAKTDLPAATEEAKRIAENYTEEVWGDTAKPFTAKAREVLFKLSPGN